MPETENKAERYILQDLLGAGGQGRTYKALDQKTGNFVAVKVIQLGNGGWKSYDLFERECQTLRALTFPGIPSYLDTFASPEEGKYYLVMELFEGLTLDKMLRENHNFSEKELFGLLREILSILEYLHQRHPPVIHRDIKPANLMLREGSKVALLDFGGVRNALRPEGGSTVVGTFGYMAPEQLHGAATPATDIYSLGATLVALATGTEADKLPRRGLKLDLSTVMQASPLRSILEKMLEPDPDHRLSSVGAVRALLPEFAGTGVTPAVGRDQHGDMILLSDRPSALAEPPGGELSDAPRAAQTVIRIIGSLGYVGIFFVEALLLPLLFSLFGSGSTKNPKKRAKRQRSEGKVIQKLQQGRQRFKALAEGRNPNSAQRSLPAPPQRPALPAIEPSESDRDQRSGRN